MSEPLPNGSLVTKDNGVNGLWVPPGEKVTLGDFSSRCFADATVCNNFTVSFLVKMNGSIPENETVDIIHQMPITDASHRVQFTVSNNNSHFKAVAIVSRDLNETMASAVFSFTEKWIHVALIYRGPGDLEIFLNGTNDKLNASLVYFNGSIPQVNMTLGASMSSNGFLASYLQVFEYAIQGDVNSLKDESFTQGTLA